MKSAKAQICHEKTCRN